MSRTPRSHLALDQTHRSGGSASQPLVAIAAIGDYLAEGAIAVNARRTITYANRAAAALLGLRTDVLIGRDVLATALAAESSLFARALTEVLARGSEQLITVGDSDTSPPFNVDYCRLLPIADGGALILLGEVISPSNTGRTRANAMLIGDLERRAARFSAVAKVQLAMSRTEVRDVYAEIHRAVATLIPNAACFALLLADDIAPLFRPQLIVVEGIVTWARALAPVPLTECAASRSLRTGEAVLSNRPERSWSALVPGAVSTEARTYLALELAVPVVHGDRILGVLVVQSYQRDAFDSDDTELLSIIAHQAGVRH